MVRKRKPGAGRKPKATAQRKSATINSRVGADLRKELDRRAKASGHSLSKEVSTRLRLSFSHRPDALGDEQTRAMALGIARIATWVQTATFQSWSTNRFTFDAMVSGIRHFLDNPAIAPDGPSEPVGLMRLRIDQAMEEGNTAQAEQYSDPNTLGLSAALGVIHEMSGPGPDDVPPSGSMKIVAAAGQNADNWNEDLRIQGEKLIRRNKGKEIAK